MKVFDFDNTLYQGESVFDFAMFILRKKKAFLFYLPDFMKLLILYKMRRMDIASFTKALEKYSQTFLKYREEILSYADDFWQKNLHKIDQQMIEKVGKNDVIVTASPTFLLNYIKNVIPTKHILGTKVDLEEGKILFLNFQENKVKYFKEEYGEAKIHQFYTDSLNDQAMMEISEQVFLVKKGICKQIK